MQYLTFLFLAGMLMRPEHSETKAKTETGECATKTETKNYETETGMIKVEQICFVI